MTFDSNKVELGTVSHGTLRPQDLAPAFANYALYIGIDVSQELIDAAEAIYNDTYEGEDAAEVLIELGDLIDEALPTFLRFGTHEGDGADWGIWAVDWYSEELVEALLQVEKAREGDSNDAEIEALTEALDAALAQIGDEHL